MKGHNRKFYSGSLNHCYQNTKNGYLLFYSDIDYLVFFTIFCITASRFGVQVMKLCLMPDHVHFTVKASSRKELYSFVRDTTKLFAKLQNEYCGRRGALFNSPFGSAPKNDTKRIRTNFIYVDNNPVERHLVEYAEEYRWNFIAYARSINPFSEKYDSGKASQCLIDAICLVVERHNSGRPLNYPLVKLLMRHLDNRERNQLIDHIITTFSVIDHEAAIRFFGSYESMLLADHSTTGSEYDLKEVFAGKQDDVYGQMTAQLMKTGRFKEIHDVLRLPDAERFDLLVYLSGKTAATPEQLLKYFRLKVSLR